jgi:uncharacterized phage-associated protein
MQQATYTANQYQPTVDDIADYFIVRCVTGGVPLNVLKLQKLAYYAQAWHLAFYDERLFDDEFQAWVHGPVCRALYDRFRDTKSLYSPVFEADVRRGFDPDRLPTTVRAHLEEILEAYAHFSGAQLESLTHSEAPWEQARNGYGPAERCSNVIGDRAMQDFYKQRLG